MRIAAAAAVAVAAGFLASTAREARAQQQWCAYYDAYTYNCGFRSFAQCLATISGVGGACRRNPFATVEQRRPPRNPPRTPGPDRYR